jgi:acetyl-CoA acyltransferase
MNAACIVDAVRTPIAKGKASGAYAGVHPVDLHAHALRARLERTAIDPLAIDDSPVGSSR